MKPLFIVLCVGLAYAVGVESQQRTLNIPGPIAWNGVIVDAPNTGDADNRTFFRGDGSWAGVGVQDAAHALLTSAMSTMSSTYQTILSASVTSGEAGDRAIVHVTGRIGWMGSALFVADQFGSELWQVEDPSRPQDAALEGAFPAGVSSLSGITSHGGSLYIVEHVRDIWRIDDPTSPGSAVLEGRLPSGVSTPDGIASHGGSLYVVNSLGDDLWRIDDPTSPGSAVREGAFPAGVSSPRGITSHGGSLYVADITGVDLWRIDDPTDPGSAVLEGVFPTGLINPRGMTSHGGSLYVVDQSNSELWRIDDATSPADAVLEGAFPSGLINPEGITSIGEAPCDIRVARGNTDVAVFTLEEGTILFDTTFTDAPPAGTHAYAWQMKTSDPNTVCTAYLGGGVLPIPSLFVEMFYGGG